VNSIIIRHCVSSYCVNIAFKHRCTNIRSWFWGWILQSFVRPLFHILSPTLSFLYSFWNEKFPYITRWTIGVGSITYKQVYQYLNIYLNTLNSLLLWAKVRIQKFIFFKYDLMCFYVYNNYLSVHVGLCECTKFTSFLTIKFFIWTHLSLPFKGCFLQTCVGIIWPVNKNNNNTYRQKLLMHCVFKLSFLNPLSLEIVILTIKNQLPTLPYYANIKIIPKLILND